LSQSLEESDDNPLSAVSISDEDTRSALREVFEKYHYVADPHTAVAASALSYSTSNRLPADADKIIVSTAHPAKFGSTVEEVLGFAPDLPQQLTHISNAEEHIHPLHNSYEALCSELTASNPNI
jgi:threonine synthase